MRYWFKPYLPVFSCLPFSPTLWYGFTSKRLIGLMIYINPFCILYYPLGTLRDVDFISDSDAEEFLTGATNAYSTHTQNGIKHLNESC